MILKYLKKFLEYFCGLIEDDRKFIAVMLLLNFTALAHMYFFYNDPADVAHFSLTAFFKVSFFILIYALIIKQIKFKLIGKILKYILMSVSAIMFLVDFFCLYQYNSLLNQAMFEIFLATNPSESEEFIETYVLQPPIWILLLKILIVGTILYEIFVRIIFKNHIMLNTFVAATMIVGIVALITHLGLMCKNFNSVNRISYIIPSAYNDIQIYETLLRESKKDIKLTQNDSTIPMVVFILGEATNKNHMQLYGYNLPTTPNLVKLNGSGNLYVFNDVISPHSHTMAVLENLFTFYRVGAENYWFNYANLFDILRAAGYHTEWLSNQEMSGVYGNVGKVYANICDDNKFTKLRDSNDDIDYTGIYYDDLLLNLFDESLKNIKGDKNFYVLHVMGAHASYKHRYPEEFDKFSAADEMIAEGVEDADMKRQIRAEYDNAILYDDYIVNEIIKRIENKNAILIYISDHGEDVFDEWEFAGHMESKGTRSMIEIPMIIWTSDQFKKAYPKIVDEIAKSVDKPFMTDDMIHVILDIMRIETEDFDPQKSIINPDFDESRERIYSNRIYDKEHGLK